jgi:uncharacterized protein GlcG (DUF336 family)
MTFNRGAFVRNAVAGLLALQGTVHAQQRATCADLPSHADLQTALRAVVSGGNNGGFGLHMWATVVNRDGEVCAVAFSGANRGEQWPGSRVISAQKANTANAFSLPRFALSTANLYAATQPGGSLYGLPHTNPVDARAVYQGNASNYGQPNDPLVGDKPGGVNVFGGGLALYTSVGRLVGAVGVSGDTSCADHIIAWKLRSRLNLDNVPGGPDPATNTDNIVFDLVPGEINNIASTSGWGHPACSPEARQIGNSLPVTFPVGPGQLPRP